MVKHFTRLLSEHYAGVSKTDESKRTNGVPFWSVLDQQTSDAACPIVRYHETLGAHSKQCIPMPSVRWVRYN